MSKRARCTSYSLSDEEQETQVAAVKPMRTEKNQRGVYIEHKGTQNGYLCHAMDLSFFLLYLFGGFIAGIVNTLAGNGSAITLTLLMASGMGGLAANTTNRIGVMVQTITSVWSLPATHRKTYLLKSGLSLTLPVILGALAGAGLAATLDDKTMELWIGVLMLVLLATLLVHPDRWKSPSDRANKLPVWLRFLLFFLVGLYGGFIQMGIGLVLLAALVLVEKWSLRDGNVIKLWLAIAVVVPAFFLLLFTGTMQWGPGLTLALGSAIGAWVSARYMVRAPYWQSTVRVVLVIALLLGAAKSFYTLWNA